VCVCVCVCVCVRVCVCVCVDVYMHDVIRALSCESQVIVSLVSSNGANKPYYRTAKGQLIESINGIIYGLIKQIRF